MDKDLIKKLEILGIEKKVPVSIHLLEKVSSSSVAKITLVNNKKYKSSQMLCVPYYKPIF